MKKILIIEDEPAYMQLLHDQLIGEGYGVVQAHDGNIGLDIAKKEKPDLILLDIKLPVMDGLTMLKKLREDPWGKTVYVIVLTNLEDSVTISNGLSEHILHYIIKSDASLSSIMDDIKLHVKE